MSSFDEFEEPQLQKIMLPPMGDSITVSGNQSNMTSIVITKDAEFNPDGDAMLIESILASRLPQSTMHSLLKYLILRNGEVAFSIMKQFMDPPEPPAPKTPRRRSKKVDLDEE